jgi:hypothetical protein
MVTDQIEELAEDDRSLAVLVEMLFSAATSDSTSSANLDATPAFCSKTSSAFPFSPAEAFVSTCSEADL